MTDVDRLAVLSAAVEGSKRRPEWWRTQTRKGWTLGNEVFVWPNGSGFVVKVGLHGRTQLCPSAVTAVALAELLA